MRAQQSQAAAPRPKRETAAFACLALSIAVVVISVAASQILLAAAAVLFFAGRRRLPSWPSRPPAIVWAFSGLFLWTVLAALCSEQPLPDLRGLKKFFLFLVFFMTPFLMKAAGARLGVHRLVFATGTMAASWGVFQYLSVPGRDINQRITGFMSHWMTYSGLLMLVVVALAAYALCFGIRRNWWTIPAGSVVAAGMYLSETRNTLLGAVAALIVLFLLTKHYRALAAGAAIVVLVYSVSPNRMQDRLTAAFDLEHPHTRPRVELFRTALRLIADQPLLGVGPGSVAGEALSYRVTAEYPDWAYMHMHNNFLQIAAERGIPGLLLWIWFMAQLMRDAFTRFRLTRGSASEDLMASLAALGAVTALLVAGLFEYNFGDSEVLTLFLFMAAAPYVKRQEPGFHGPIDD